MRPGRYRATADFTLKLCRHSMGGATCPVETRAVVAGEEFSVPETVNGYFYAGGITPEESAELIAEFSYGEDDPQLLPNVVRIG